MIEVLKNGERRPMRVRRIGPDHAIVMPSQTATLVDVSKMRRELAGHVANVARFEKQIAATRERIQVLSDFLGAFDASEVERHPDDPETQSEPVTEG